MACWVASSPHKGVLRNPNQSCRRGEEACPKLWLLALGLTVLSANSTLGMSRFCWLSEYSHAERHGSLAKARLTAWFGNAMLILIARLVDSYQTLSLDAQVRHASKGRYMKNLPNGICTVSGHSVDIATPRTPETQAP